MQRGDLLYVNLGDQTGREQAGRRPAIAVIANNAPAGNPMTVVVPLTTNMATLRFPHTFQISPSSMNQLVAESVVLVFQLRALDRLKIVDVRGHMEDDYLARLDNELRSMLGL
jgi:mRNA interferase MazF